MVAVTTGAVYHLEITLEEVKPPIWRWVKAQERFRGMSDMDRICAHISPPVRQGTGRTSPGSRRAP